MHDPFAKKVVNNDTIGQLLFKEIVAEQDFVKIVDVGARNGIQWPNSLSSKTHLYGFEPNKAEYKKLVNHNSDAQILDITQKKFGKEDYFNCAVWSSSEERAFFLTQGPGACTLMGEANPTVTSNMWMDWTGENYYDAHTKVIDTVSIPCHKLDDLMPHEIEIDFLKLDVEGAELDVLEGAKRLLGEKRISLIKTEFVLFPYYSHHPVLGNQHAYLNELGYRLLTIVLDKSTYAWGKSTSIPQEADNRLHYAGDAYFFIDPDKNPIGGARAYRAGLVLIAQGFKSFGMELIRRSGYFEEKILIEVEHALRHMPRNQRLRYLWNSLPDRILNLIRR